MDLNGYYERISNIRARILSRNKAQQKSQGKYDYTTFATQQKQVDYVPRPNMEYRMYEDKPVLKEKDDNYDVGNRLKQLDSVNDRIKMVLGSKRQPSTNNSRTYEYRSNERSRGKLDRVMIESKIIEKENDNKYERRYENKSYEKQMLEHRFSFSKNEEVTKHIETKTKLDQSIYETPFKLDNKRLNHQKSIIDEYVPEKSKIQMASSSIFQGEKNQAKKLVQSIVNQINIDIELRELRQKFDSYGNKDKWSQLQKQFQFYTVTMSKDQLKQWVAINSQEFNPFTQLTSIKSFDFPKLIEKIIESRNNWIKNVKQSVSISTLENEKWSIKDIDVYNKGHVSIEDMVCWINVNSDRSYRNRDFVSFFRRIEKSPMQDKCGRMSYENFLNFVTR